MPPRSSLKIAITGATGMVGTALTAHLSARGDRVIAVSRQRVPGGIQWAPESESLDPAPFEGLDAVIHLAGEGIAQARWTRARKQRLRDSRIGPTRLLANMLARLSTPPRLLISASAMGIYGDRGEEILSETSTLAKDFLGTLATDWERAANPAQDAGIRVVHPRFGIILSPRGGALAKMLPTAQLGLGGPLGSGRQWMSWVSIDDVCGALLHVIEHEAISGPVNIATPSPVQNAEFAATLGKVLGRPAVIPVPAIALKLIFGEMAEATLLGSTRLVPRVLEQSRYAFRYPFLEPALLHLMQS